MTDEEQTVLLIKGTISELPATEAEACLELADFLRQAVAKAGMPVGPMAIALVGAQMQLEASK